MANTQYSDRLKSIVATLFERDIPIPELVTATGVNRKTLHRWKNDANFREKYQITDQELLETVKTKPLSVVRGLITPEDGGRPVVQLVPINDVLSPIGATESTGGTLTPPTLDLALREAMVRAERMNKNIDYLLDGCDLMREGSGDYEGWTPTQQLKYVSGVHAQVAKSFANFQSLYQVDYLLRELSKLQSQVAKSAQAAA